MSGKKSKKRDKAYNPKGLHQRYSNRRLNRLMVTYVGGNNGKSFIVDRFSKFVYRKISTEMEKDLLERKHNWTIYCAVLCRDNFGINYVKAEELYFHTPVLQSEIQDYLHNYHRAFVEKQNKQHVINIAWIAVPTNVELDEEFAYDIFDMFGGFNCLSLWEKLR